ncbi:MAG: Na+/H+ antiporter subunit E [Microbacteriaceae bacterium]|nr:Na+/H+ antiporter subunit E [Microbacteriaceae bacterium]
MTRRPSWLAQLPLLVGLVVLWLALWGHIDAISVVTGIAFAVLVVQVFRLPPVELSSRFHLGWTIVLIGRFLFWVMRASFQVAWYAVRPKPAPVSSIIAVRMRTNSDWLLTLAAEMNILVPGSVVVDVDRMRGVLYLHVLAAGDDDEVESARRFAFRIEESLVRALGSHEDIHRINRDRAEQGRRPIIVSRAQRRYDAEREAERRRQQQEWEEAQ